MSSPPHPPSSIGQDWLSNKRRSHSFTSGHFALINNWAVKRWFIYLSFVHLLTLPPLCFLHSYVPENKTHPAATRWPGQRLQLLRHPGGWRQVVRRFLHQQNLWAPPGGRSWLAAGGPSGLCSEELHQSAQAAQQISLQEVLREKRPLTKQLLIKSRSSCAVHILYYAKKNPTQLLTLFMTGGATNVLFLVYFIYCRSLTDDVSFISPFICYMTFHNFVQSTKLVYLQCVHVWVCVCVCCFVDYSINYTCFWFVFFLIYLVFFFSMRLLFRVRIHSDFFFCEAGLKTKCQQHTTVQVQWQLSICFVFLGGGVVVGFFLLI